MRHSLFLAVLTCSLIVGSLSCNAGDGDTFDEVRADRAKLIAPFESYERSQTVQERLRDKGLEWNVVEDNKTASKDETRPPFHVYVIRIGDFSDLGFKGVLRLEFFNDRLMAAWFYPDNFSSYRAAIEESHPQMRGRTSATIAPHVRVSFGSDYEEHNYVAWEDTRLREQFNHWIKRYS